MSPRLWSAKELAQRAESLIGHPVSIHSIYGYFRTGRIPTIKIGSSRFALTCNLEEIFRLRPCLGCK